MGPVQLLVATLVLHLRPHRAEDVCAQPGTTANRVSSLALLQRNRSVETSRLMDETEELTCADFSQWPEVKDHVTCGRCTALVRTRHNGGRCDRYCASFGHTCVAAHEEKWDNCEIKKNYGCSEAIRWTSDMLCTCEGSTMAPAPAPAPAPGPTQLTCAEFTQWPEVKDSVTCGRCTALVRTRDNGGRCDRYCASFGHTCVAAHEETSDNCEIKQEYRCSEAIRQTSDMLCTCESSSGGPSPGPVVPTPVVPTPAPVPSPAPGPTEPTCADFAQWPEVKDSVTCGKCTALVHTRHNGGRCDLYCASFGHTCVSAYEEKSNDCEVKREYGCSEAIWGTSDMLCKCSRSGGRGPVVPSDTTLVNTSCVELMLLGDYGSRRSTQAKVAAGMARVAGRTPPAAIAGLGDNIYPSGAEGRPETIARWWRDVYMRHAALRRDWYVVMGNHDWYTDARVQRDFTTHRLNTGGHWRVPGFWYKRTFKSRTSGLTVDTFWIDTQIWKGSSKVDRYAPRNAKDTMKRWLEGALRDSTADWKVVMGHHPVFSRGSHGITWQLFNELDPIMRRHGVQAFVAGHDHSKHLVRYEGLSYVVNGGGGKYPRGTTDEYPRGGLVADHQDPGFATMRLCKSAPGDLVFYDKYGSAQSSSKIPEAPPARRLSGSVKLANGRRAQLPRGFSILSSETQEPGPELRCAGRVMRDVDRFCPSPDGSGCRVIADQDTALTCEHYCRAVNGLACRGGWREEDEDCTPAAELGCHEASHSNDAMICECGPGPGSP